MKNETQNRVVIKHLNVSLKEFRKTQTLTGLLNLYNEKLLGSIIKTGEDVYTIIYKQIVDLEERDVKIKFDNSHKTQSVVIIDTQGKSISRQRFAFEEWYASEYFTHKGSLAFRTFTKSASLSVYDDEVYLKLVYELWSGENKIGDYQFNLSTEY